MATHAAAHARLFLRLPRPLECRHGRDDHGRRSALLQCGVRLRSRPVLLRLLPGGNSQQPDPPQGRRAPMDRPHPPHLGHPRRPDRLRLERLELLRQPCPAGGGRGRFLSRRAALPDMVVPLVLPLPDDGPVPVRQRDLAVHRAARRRVAPAVARPGRDARLAVALHSRRAAADHHLRHRLRAADRPAA